MLLWECPGYPGTKTFLGNPGSLRMAAGFDVNFRGLTLSCSLVRQAIIDIAV